MELLIQITVLIKKISYILWKSLFQTMIKSILSMLKGIVLSLMQSVLMFNIYIFNCCWTKIYSLKVICILFRYYNSKSDYGLKSSDFWIDELKHWICRRKCSSFKLNIDTTKLQSWGYFQKIVSISKSNDFC